MPFAGRSVSVGIAKESSRGTWVDAAYWIPVSSLDFDDKFDVIENDASYGVLNDVTGAAMSKKWAEGDLEGPIGDTSIGLVLKSLFGTENKTTTSGESAVYDHAFTLQTSAQHPSLSVTKKDSVRTFGFTNAMVTGLEINAALDSFATAKISLRGQAGATQTSTPSYTTENLFHRTGITFLRSTSLAGLDSGTAVKVKSCKLTFNPNVVDDDVLGTAAPNDFLNTEFRAEGEIELLYEADTYHDFVKDQTATYYRLKLTNPTLLGVASYPTLQFDFAKVASKEWSRKDELGNIVSQTVKFVAKYNTTDALAVQVLLRNTLSSVY